MTQEQIKKFKEFYNGWVPTEEQFQYAVNILRQGHWCENLMEETIKKIDYLLKQPNISKIWNSDIIPLLENLKVYDKIDKENRELYGVKELSQL